MKIPSVLNNINYDSQSLPENCFFCLTCVFPDFSGFLSLAPYLPKVEVPLAFSGTTHLFKDCLDEVPCITLDRGTRTVRLFGALLFLSFLALICASLLFVSREDGLCKVLKSQSKCTLKIALAFQRLFFFSMFCTIVSSFATLQAFSKEWKNCQSSHHPYKKGHSRISGHEKNSIFWSLTWTLKVT